MNSDTLSRAFISTVVLGILHWTGEIFYLYWAIWWFDILMHFLGGLTIGYILVWLLFDSGIFYKEVQSRALVTYTVLALVIFVALGWEMFEYILDIADDGHQSYSLDTTIDLIMGSIGAIVASLTRHSPRSS